MFCGRWNHKSVPCIYTSETRAFALLEYTVNINIDEIPRALSIITFEIPDQEIEIVSQEKLPGNWTEIPAPASTKDFGTILLKNSAKGIFKIPSSVMPYEFNYLLNPLHPSAKNFKLIEIIDFVYDVRIKLV